MLEVHLLGKFEIKRYGFPITLSSRPAQSLFAYLILTAGTAHRREKLAGMLWPDSLEETARDNLRHALWRLRKALPSQSKAEYLLTDDLTIAFNASAKYWLDAAELEKVSENATADELISVLTAYQGELLSGFYDEWVVLEREHLNSVFEHCMARLMSLLQDGKRWLDILDWGERWIKLGQKPEPAYRALMSAHAAQGDMSKVAATYERCVKSLREFGIEPSEQTRQLYHNLKTGKDVPKTEPISTKASSPKVASTNFPIPLTSFIGREKEIDEIVRLVSKNRLLTLTGSGGVGKTRLAIQSSNKLAGQFKDGLWWVDLVGLNDPLIMPQVIANVVGVREASSEPIMETLKNALKSKDLLLVLDNCEHLIEAAAKYAEHLLAACPNLKILATSRERLGIFNETTWHVPSLPLPEGRSFSVKELKAFASVGLFVERTKNVKPDFALTKQNATLVSQICQRLDGIPLAIELAAARVKVISLEEILLRLDDRFSLLTAGSRTSLPHQQTLRATIDWSYGLLTEPERILFRRLAVFAGGFKLEAVETVCSFGELKRADVLDLLARLADKSLVIVHNAVVNSGTRYRLLETIREYAREKLESSGEAGITRDRHLEFFMKLAEEAELHHFSSEQLVWFDRVQAEVDNMRAALDWSIADDQSQDSKNKAWRQETGLRAIGALVWFWHRSYARETSERLKQMVTIIHKPTLGRARALYSLGFLYWTVNNFSEARLALEEAVTISRKFDDGLTLARSLGYLGAVAAAKGDYASTQSLLEESLGIARQFGPAGRKAASWALAFLGDVPFAHGNYSSAKKLYEEAVALIKESHEKNMLGLMIRRLGYVALKQLDYTQATEYFKESLELNQKVGHSVGIYASLTAFANLALAQGKASRAAQLYGAVERYLNLLASPLFYSDEIEYQLGILDLRKQPMDAVLEKAWGKGAEMTIEQAMEFALKGARV